MGSRAQVRITIEHQHINVTTHWAGLTLLLTVQEAVKEAVASGASQFWQTEAAYLLARLLDCSKTGYAGQEELPDRKVCVGPVTLCADHQGLEVDCDADKVRLYDSNFGQVKKEWTIEEFLSVDVDLRGQELFFDEPEEEPSWWGTWAATMSPVTNP